MCISWNHTRSYHSALQLSESNSIQSMLLCYLHDSHHAFLHHWTFIRRNHSHVWSALRSSIWTGFVPGDARVPTKPKRIKIIQDIQCCIPCDSRNCGFHSLIQYDKFTLIQKIKANEYILVTINNNDVVTIQISLSH